MHIDTREDDRLANRLVGGTLFFVALIAFLAGLLVGCDDGEARRKPVKPSSGWSATHGEAAAGTPLPEPVVDIPTSGTVNYVTRAGSLAGKTRITLRYRVEMEPGTQILPKGFPELPSMLSLYFQRCGDTWGVRDGDAYRWYSPRIDSPITAGPHELSVGLGENWTAVLTSSSVNNPEGFKAAIDDTCRVGFVLGGGSGRGHGVYATGPARLVIDGFAVE